MKQHTLSTHPMRTTRRHFIAVGTALTALPAALRAAAPAWTPRETATPDHAGFAAGVALSIAVAQLRVVNSARALRSRTRIAPLCFVFLMAGVIASANVGTLRADLDITASSTPLVPPKDDPAVLVHHATDDKGGNTSLRFMANRKVDENKYPTNGVTVFAQAPREQPQRDRDLGQTFLTGEKGGTLDSLYLRIGHADLAMLTNAPGARVAVQWFEVTGEPRLKDHATPGFAGKFDRKTSPELDDYLEGETYKPLRVVEGRLPAKLDKSDYLQFDFTGDDEFTFEPRRTYAFLLMFLDRAPQRGVTLANEYYGTYTPDPANKFRGHGMRREGLPSFPDEWHSRLDQPPGTLGFPDVCTFRDLHFAVTVKGLEAPKPVYEVRDIDGWRVLVQRTLLDREAELTARALELLQNQLAEINRVVPVPAAKSLRAVPLYFSPEYPGFGPTAEFHPDAGWLRANNRDPAMAQAIEFTNIRRFEAEVDRMPNFTLHELAHAYHHRVLAEGFANPEIKAAYDRAKANGGYDRVERWLGSGKSNTFERAYAMNNPMEYFAETTEAFFSRNDFFPFTRNELKAHDPVMFALLAKLWGAQAKAEASGLPQRKTAHAHQQAPVDFNHPPRECVTHHLYGWEVLVEKQLADEAPELAKKTLARVEEKLGEVAALLPPASLPDLKKLRVFILFGPKAMAGGRTNGLEYYHRDAPKHWDWLDARMASSIVIFNADNYAKLSEAWALRSLFHEFGHAYHLEHWPEDRADIYDTWQAAMKAGLYQVVREEDKGTHNPNYAAQNHLEYFAELSKTYFVGNSYFPRDRAALKTYDPAGYALIERLWDLNSKTSELAKPETDNPPASTEEPKN